VEQHLGRSSPAFTAKEVRLGLTQPIQQRHVNRLLPNRCNFWDLVTSTAACGDSCGLKKSSGTDFGVRCVSLTDSVSFARIFY
jgi:hypothetical protein